MLCALSALGVRKSNSQSFDAMCTSLAITQASLGGCQGLAFPEVLASKYHAPGGDWSSADGCDLVPTDECTADNVYCSFWSVAVDGSTDINMGQHEGQS